MRFCNPILLDGRDPAPVLRTRGEWRRPRHQYRRGSRRWPQDGTHPEVSERARSRWGSATAYRALSASASLSKIECDQSDDGGDEQEDRVHCCLLNESSSLLLIVERARFKSTNPTSSEFSPDLPLVPLVNGEDGAENGAGKLRSQNVHV